MILSKFKAYKIENLLARRIERKLTHPFSIPSNHHIITFEFPHQGRNHLQVLWTLMVLLKNLNIKLLILFISINLMWKIFITISPWSYIDEYRDHKPLIINGINASITSSFLRHILPLFLHKKLVCHLRKIPFCSENHVVIFCSPIHHSEDKVSF